MVFVFSWYWTRVAKGIETDFSQEKQIEEYRRYKWCLKIMIKLG
jgi:hypothetical protein